ncbi:MAG TPA: CD3324 family protein [Mobilitalea sp.]|nr:CD3324 family protein [Mobilitalea sp.]
MSYVKADCILPREILELVQEYADGQYLYIPKKASNHKVWGANTNSKNEVKQRNFNIYRKSLYGTNISSLAKEYYLSEKSIQRILLQQKRIQVDIIE